ncbi:RNase adapter RapZ [Halothiobacillus sp. DCM-1]|uniref:RNase adapter RapZ n=1 Tax=Halothiobacillus sp. DCM-1 TaxID=3112558 RepID=UPI00324B7038
MTDAKPLMMIVTGHSGSGKSIALAALEDAGFYCIDNLPPELLDGLLQIHQHNPLGEHGIAISIDARSPESTLQTLPERIRALKRQYPGWRVQSLFLQAAQDRLVARFSETRRRHPLSSRAHTLLQAIEHEAALLSPLRAQADWVIDTSHTTLHQFREDLHRRVLAPAHAGPVILLQSFGFKRGLPLDSDFVFDVRHLPNPHWLETLRPQTGQHAAVRDYLEQHPVTHETRAQLRQFLDLSLTAQTRTDRSYITCSIGCTGGQHRSVYLVEQLYHDLQPKFPLLQIRHRDLLPESIPS